MAQNGAERSESDEEEFKNLSEGIKTNIQTLVQTLTKIQMMISKLDSTKDVFPLQNKILELINTSSGIATQTNVMMESLNHLFRKSAGQSPKLWNIVRDSLQKEFDSTLAKYKAVEAEVHKMTAKQEIAVKRSSQRMSAEPKRRRSSIFGSKKTFQDEQLKLAELKDRESAFRRLESDLVGLNEIMKSLALMAHEQGAKVDKIATSVEHVLENAQEGAASISEAAEEQKKSRKKLLIIALIFFILLAIIVGTLIGALK